MIRKEGTRHWRSAAARGLAPLRNQRGVALLMALFSVTMMLVIAVELTYDTTVEFQASAQQLNRLKAYHAARSGFEIALLRIKIYQTIAGQIAGIQGPARQMIPMNMIDKIWQMPFMWPPPFGADMSAVDKDKLKKDVDEAFMDAQYTVNISAESGKLDLNDLGSPIQSLAFATRNQLLMSLRGRVEQDEELAKRYRGFRFEELVNNITDWVDMDNQSFNGGDERSHYQQSSITGRFLPPNQPFRTPDEVRMVAKMTDDLFDLIMGIATIFGIKGVNVNYSDERGLMSLHPRMTPEIAKRIMEYREKVRFFQNKDEFLGFLRGQGIDARMFEGPEAVPLYFDPENVFRITSTGVIGRSSREIIAIAYDFDRVIRNVGSAIATDDATNRNQFAQPNTGNAPNPNQSAGPTAGQQVNPALRNQGRPTVIYWQED